MGVTPAKQSESSDWYSHVQPGLYIKASRPTTISFLILLHKVQLTGSSQRPPHAQMDKYISKSRHTNPKVLE